MFDVGVPATSIAAVGNAPQFGHSTATATCREPLVYLFNPIGGNVVGRWGKPSERELVTLLHETKEVLAAGAVTIEANAPITQIVY